MLNKAIKIAVDTHSTQLDKGDVPYILHPLRVMLTRDNELERICAVLHDVVEDSKITFDDLRNEGFSEEVITVLDCLTNREGEDYDGFIDRILKNKTACKVKLADIEDNMDMTRIPHPSPKDLERLLKYQRAHQRISDALKDDQ